MSRIKHYIDMCRERDRDPEDYDTDIIEAIVREREHSRMLAAMKQIQVMHEQDQDDREQALRDHMADDPEANDYVSFSIDYGEPK